MAPLCVKERRIRMKLKNIISGFALSLALVSATYLGVSASTQVNAYADEDEVTIVKVVRPLYADGAESSEAAYTDEQVLGVAAQFETLGTTLNVRQYNISADAIETVFKKAQEHNPVYAYAYGFIQSYSYSMTSGGIVTSIYLDSEHTQDELKQRYNQMRAKITEIENGIDSKMTVEQKVLYVHDYLAYNVAYDMKNYRAGTIPNDSYSAYGALVNGTSVCQGYSEAMQAVMFDIGIPCEVVSSAALNHAWNQVYVNGNWYHVDVTWDDPTMSYTSSSGGYAPSSGDDMLGNCSHEYFLSSDREFKNGKHTSWDAGARTCTSDKYASLTIRNISSRVYTVNGKSYYLYSEPDSTYLNSHLYTGDPFGTSKGTLLDGSIQGYDYNLGYFDNNLYYDNYFYGNMYRYNIGEGNVYDFTDEAGIAKKVAELKIDDNGLITYILKDSADELTYQLKSTKLDPLVNTSFVAQHAVVGEKVVLKGSATGGDGNYKFAYYYRKNSDKDWITVGTEWGTSLYATFKPGSATVYEVCIKVQDGTGNIVKKYLSFAANKSENDFECYGSLSSWNYKLGKAITIKGWTENSTGKVKYKYEFRKASSWTYETIKDYSDSTSVSWTAPQKGAFTIRITADDGTNKAIRTMNLKVK